MASLSIRLQPPGVPYCYTTSRPPPLTTPIGPSPPTLQVYYPGALIVGALHLNTPNPTPISRATITLRGRAKVKIRSSEHYTTRTFRSRALFFPPITLTLFDSSQVLAGADGGDGDGADASRVGGSGAGGGGSGTHFTHKAGEYIWPFEFWLPAKCDVHAIVMGRLNSGLGTAPGSSAFISTTRPKRRLDRMGFMQQVETDPQLGSDGEKEGRQWWENDYFTPRKPWRGSRDPRHHPVLDSFEYVSSRWPVDWEGRVEYSLLATVSRPGGGLLFPVKDLTTSTDLRVKSLAPDEAERLLRQKQSRTVTQTVSSLRLPIMSSSSTSNSNDNNVTDPNSTDRPTQLRRLSLLDRTQSLLRPSTVPKQDITISMETATHVKLGSPLSIGLRLVSPSSPYSPTSGESGSDPRPNPSRMTLLPTTILKSLTISLHATTAVRDNATSALEQQVQRTDAMLLFKKKDVDRPFPPLSPSPSSPNPRLTIADLSSDPLLVPVTLPPTFTTYNIARWYTLAVDLKVECAGESVNFSLPDVSITLISETSMVSRPPGSAPRTRRQRREQRAPSYDAVVTANTTTNEDGSRWERDEKREIQRREQEQQQQQQQEEEERQRQQRPRDDMATSPPRPPTSARSPPPPPLLPLPSPPPPSTTEEEYLPAYEP